MGIVGSHTKKAGRIVQHMIRLAQIARKKVTLEPFAKVLRRSLRNPKKLTMLRRKRL